MYIRRIIILNIVYVVFEINIDICNANMGFTLVGGGGGGGISIRIAIVHFIWFILSS